MASASLVFCTHTPTAPACICSRASAELLCILACGRQRMSCLRAKSAIRLRLRCMASRSTTRAGVSIAETGWPTSRLRSSERGVFVVGCMFQVLRVRPSHEREAFGRPQQPVDRSVGQLPGARRIHLLAGGDAVQRVEHSPVRHHRDLFPAMARSEVADGTLHAFAQLQQRLAAIGRLPFRNAAPPVGGVLGPVLLDLVEGLALEHAEAPLAQTRVRDHRDARGIPDGAGRLVRAPEVAGVHGAQLLAGERLPHAARLPPPGVVQLDVELALDPRVHVPGRLAMPYGNDAGGVHGGHCREAPPEAKRGRAGRYDLVPSCTSTRRGPGGGLGKPCRAASNIAGSTTRLSNTGPSLVAWLSKTTRLAGSSRITMLTSRRNQYESRPRHGPPKPIAPWWPPKPTLHPPPQPQYGSW